QNRLFTVGAELATAPGKTHVKTPVLIPGDIDVLENSIDKMEEPLPPLKNFILPGGDRAASYCHVSRCVCRRAERIVTALAEYEVVAEKIFHYLNRLSLYLFVLARVYTWKNGGKETLWKTRN